jgi:NAD(P)H-dependent FMN reductase
MCHYAVQALASHGLAAQLIDLAALEIHLYPHSENQPAVQAALAQFNGAHGWVLAAPIYNYGASGILLNFLHYALDSDLGRWKPFVLLASMGGQRSALASDHVARTLIYEVNAVQVGPAINNYGDTGVNRSTGEMSPDLRQRMDAQLAVLARYVQTRAAMAG